MLVGVGAAMAGRQAGSRKSARSRCSAARHRAPLSRPHPASLRAADADDGAAAGRVERAGHSRRAGCGRAGPARARGGGPAAQHVAGGRGGILQQVWVWRGWEQWTGQELASRRVPCCAVLCPPPPAVAAPTSLPRPAALLQRGGQGAGAAGPGGARARPRGGTGAAGRDVHDGGVQGGAWVAGLCSDTCLRRAVHAGEAWRACCGACMAHPGAWMRCVLTPRAALPRSPSPCDLALRCRLQSTFGYLQVVNPQVYAELMQAKLDPDSPGALRRGGRALGIGGQRTGRRRRRRVVRASAAARLSSRAAPYCVLPQHLQLTETIRGTGAACWPPCSWARSRKLSSSYCCRWAAARRCVCVCGHAGRLRWGGCLQRQHAPLSPPWSAGPPCKGLRAAAAAAAVAAPTPAMVPPLPCRRAT